MEDSKVTAANSVTEQHAYHTHHYLEHRRKSKSEGYGYSVSIIYAFIYVAMFIMWPGSRRSEERVVSARRRVCSHARQRRWVLQERKSIQSLGLVPKDSPGPAPAPQQLEQNSKLHEGSLFLEKNLHDKHNIRITYLKVSVSLTQLIHSREVSLRKWIKIKTV